MKKITIIFSAINEGKEPLNTINSIYETADPKLFDIILFNDGTSDIIGKDLKLIKNKWEPIPKRKEIKVIHNKWTKGRVANLDKGVELTKTPYIFLCNARMRFKKGWMEEGLKHIEKEPKTIFCTTSVALDYDNTDIDKCTEKRYGAEILWTQNHPRHGIQILEPKWIEEKDKDIYEIPCVLGANYFMSKKWYQYIKGCEGLTTYGAEDAFLSLKSWILGGKCKIIKTIEIGNIYREAAPYIFTGDDKFWNNLFMAYTLFEWGEATYLLKQLQMKKCYTGLVYRVLHSMKLIKEYRKYFFEKRVNDYRDYITK